MENMTALVSCFSRAYHYKNNEYRILNDNLASKILSNEEYENISLNMQKGIKFFNPIFNGTKEDALKWIVDNRLSPSVLGRSAFTEDMIKKTICEGITEYLIFASGYDTFAYRNTDLLDKLTIFEIDKKEMIEDKIRRLSLAQLSNSKVNYISCDFTTNNWIDSIICSNYKKKEKSFCSLLGISYYLTKEEFNNMIYQISKIITDGSYIIFDYPTYEESIEKDTTEMLANGANEEMKSKYTISDIQEILKKCDMKLISNLDSNDMSDKYFKNYNLKNKNSIISAPKGVNYCLISKI